MLIESTGIKYTSIATRTLGVSGRAFPEALIVGECSPETLAGWQRAHFALRPSS